MGKWKKDAKEFVVGVNFFEDRGYQSAIPRPIMEKLGKPHTLKFVINDDTDTVELISGKSPMSRKGVKVN
ncbi:MAG: hypothetical protein WBE34_07095 [Candidatus Nitrosopolaris sp.]